MEPGFGGVGSAIGGVSVGVPRDAEYGAVDGGGDALHERVFTGATVHPDAAKYPVRDMYGAERDGVSESQVDSGRAIEFMKEQVAVKKPFYVQASYYAQHLSVVTSEELLVKYIKKGTPDRGYPQAWAAMMEKLDGGVGRLLDAIDEMGIGENTYVFFTADNGGRGTVPGGDEEGSLPTNFPLSGAKPGGEGSGAGRDDGETVDGFPRGGRRGDGEARSKEVRCEGKGRCGRLTGLPFFRCSVLLFSRCGGNEFSLEKA